jgi:hypothetical protein
MIELKRNNIRAKTNNKPWTKKRPLICIVCWATIKKSKTT